jgi:TorA maturation chaperone TorD
MSKSLEGVLDGDLDGREGSEAARDLYHCLSLCFDYPGFWLINEQASTTIGDTFRRLAGIPQLVRLEEELRRLHGLLISVRLGGATQLAELQIEYTRLFVGRSHPEIYPYECCFRGKGLPGTVNRELMRLYSQEGLGIGPDFKEPPDHVSTELAFSGHLYRKQVQAVRSREQQLIWIYAQKQKAFLLTHLVPWIPDFAREVERATVIDFYQSLARITREFVLWDFERSQVT